MQQDRIDYLLGQLAELPPLTDCAWERVRRILPSVRRRVASHYRHDCPDVIGERQSRATIRLMTDVGRKPEKSDAYLATSAVREAAGYEMDEARAYGVSKYFYGKGRAWAPAELREADVVIV